MRNMRIAGALGATLVVLVGCASPEPAPIYAQPTYDKFGESTGYDCPAGLRPTQGSLQPVCVPPPDDGCEIIPGTNACYPGRDDRPDNGQTGRAPARQ